jgi:hypothetical protein
VKAARLARALGDEHRAISLDVQDTAACTNAIAGHAVAIHCAGPYGPHQVAVLKACLAGRCHYVDLAEERGYNALVRGLGPHFTAVGLTAIHGASSLPGISGALATLASEGRPPERLRITLWIGNRNVKGAGAIAASLGVAGRSIETAGGELHGFGEPEHVVLPDPIGAVTAYSYDAPEYDLLPESLGVPDVTVKVAFEAGFAGPLVSWVSRLPGGRTVAMARFLSWMGSMASLFGSSGGAVQAETWSATGVRRAALVADRDGQRMAALPAALAASRLLDGRATPGACTAYELLGAGPLVEGLARAGYRLVLG